MDSGRPQEIQPAVAQPPHLGFWQIWNMSFGFLGIQFGWALQMANMSSIYEYLGADAHQIPMLWLAAPLTGLIVQPVIGHLSDRTWNRLGRRRPYFLVGALLSSAALVAMPNAPALWVAAGLLWILDASINISMEPFRAFVADLLPDEQRTRGKYWLLVSMVGVGIAWASILSMPYAMLSAALPAGKTGVYMGIFNFFIVIPEILAALVFGRLMEKVLTPTNAVVRMLGGDNRLAAVAIGGASLAVAAALVTRTVEPAQAPAANGSNGERR